MTEEKLNKKFEADIEIPSGCTFTRHNNTIVINGPKGELKRDLNDKTIIIKQEANTLNLSYDKTTQRQKKNLFTTVAHVKNMIKGVQEGYTYKLKICSGHFPMSVGIKGDTFEVKNFIGEKVPRQLKIKQGIKVAVTGDLVTVDGLDKEETGQTAAMIEKLTRRPGFDKRIFQDGIYIIEKDGKKV
jgi:large subunit ribosomal protein L6